MGELSYKELQEKGVFDVPYKAFQFMQEQQAIIDDLRQRSKDEFISITKEWHTKGWNARQGEIDDLRQQLNNMEQCYIEKKKQAEDQQKRIDAGLEKIRQFGKEGCLFPEWLTWAEKALRGES